MSILAGTAELRNNKTRHHDENFEEQTLYVQGLAKQIVMSDENENHTLQPKDRVLMNEDDIQLQAGSQSGGQQEAEESDKRQGHPDSLPVEFSSFGRWMHNVKRFRLLCGSIVNHLLSSSLLSMQS